MVRILACFLLVFLGLKGADLKSDLQNLLGENSSAIEGILQNERTFIDARGNVNYSALIAHFRSLGIPSVTPQDMQIGFLSASDDAILMIRVIENALKSMGYKYYLTTFFENHPARLVISLSSRSPIEPDALYNAFLKHNIYIKKVLRQNGLVYELDLSAARVASDELMETPIRPKRAYFIKVSSANAISISADASDNWQPFIRFFDRKLRLVKTEKRGISPSLRLEVPKNAAYALIDDIHSLENIKHGLSISLQ